MIDIVWTWLVLFILHMGIYVGNIVDGIVGILSLTKIHTTAGLYMAKLYTKVSYDTDNRRK